jgi:uncharacterized membrane protein
LFVVVLLTLIGALLLFFCFVFVCVAPVFFVLIMKQLDRTKSKSTENEVISYSDQKKIKHTPNTITLP